MKEKNKKAGKNAKTAVCQICGQHKKMSEVIPGEFVRHPLIEVILKEHPGWSSDGYICIDDMNHFRTHYVEKILEKERGEISKLEKDVVKSMRKQELLSKNVNLEFDRGLTFGERLADSFAAFGGSWRFIIIFSVIIIVWITINAVLLLSKPFDPYPFILLNLVLSCIAAFQAPVIMMSQNRQEARDRLRAEHDYRINLKAELEIRNLHEKIDHLLRIQWERLIEIQQIQMELMEEVSSKNYRKR